MKIDTISLLVVLFLLLSSLSLYSQESDTITSGFNFNRVDIPDQDYHQGLLTQKELIITQYNNEDEKKVRKLFNKDIKQFGRLVRKKHFSQASFKLYEIETLYSSIGEFQDKIIFQSVILADVTTNYDDLKKYSLLILDNFFNSEFTEEVVLYLGKSFFYLHEDDQLISLFNKYSDYQNDQMKFWVANAYYNQENYTKASEFIEYSIKDKNLALRVHCLDGLITYNLDGISGAIDKFKWIEKKYKPKYDYYSFVYLSLARLYWEIDRLDQSAHYYDLYYKITGEETPVDVLYEIGYFYEQSNDIERATFFYNEIITFHQTSIWYSHSIHNLAFLEQNAGLFDQARLRLEEHVKTNDLLQKTIDSKEKLFTLYNQLIKESEESYAEGDSVSLESIQELNSTKDAMEKSTSILLELYTGINSQDILMINNIEQEYFVNNATFQEVLRYQNQTSNNHNERIDSYIDNQISLLDSSLISLQIVRYLIPVKKVTTYDYQLASALAEERRYEEKLKESWINVGIIVSADKQESLILHSKKMIDIVDLNIEALDRIAEIKFGKIENPEILSYIDKEKIAFNNDIIEYLTLKKTYKKTYYNKIKNRLDSRRKEIYSILSGLENKYVNYLDKFKTDIIVSRKNYEVDLLDILFKESKSLDKKYDEFQHEYLGNSEYE